MPTTRPKIPSITNFKTGDIVSVEFPYSDLQGRKRRPGLVLSGDDEDLLLARVATRPASGAGDVALDDWSAAGLPKPSTVRLTKLATVDRRLVIRRIGHVSVRDGEAILRSLKTWTEKMSAELNRPGA